MEKSSKGESMIYSPVDALEASVPIADRVENDVEDVTINPSPASTIVPHSSGKNRWTVLIAAYTIGFLSGIAFTRQYPGFILPSNPPSSPSSIDGNDETDNIALPTMSPSTSHSPTYTPRPTSTYNYWTSSFQTPSPTTSPSRDPIMSFTSSPTVTYNAETTSPTAAHKVTEHKEEEPLISSNTTSFTDKNCPQQSYKSSKLYKKVLLWAHVYTPNNHPPIKPVGPFDDVPPDPINTATVLLDVKPVDYPIALALVAYDSTNWTIDVVDQSNLAQVIVTGYKAQYVTIIHNTTDIQVDIFDTTKNNGNLPGDSMWYYPSTIMPGSLKEFRADLEEYVGVPVYLYDYCYSGSTVEYLFDFST